MGALGQGGVGSLIPGGKGAVSDRAWLYCDAPVGATTGASYMLESWARELRSRGWETRVFAPSGAFAPTRRTREGVAFRTVRSLAYRGDYNARFSAVRELLRARRERPDVVIVTTPLRVGVLGMLVAAWLRVPLVVAVSTNTTGMAEHYSAARVITTMLPKLGLLLLRSRRARRRMFRGSSALSGEGTLSERLAAHAVLALQGDARELVMLAGKTVDGYADEELLAKVNVLPAGIDPLPPAPAGVCWPETSLRALYVGRYSREKSLPLLLDSVRAARDRGVDLHLTMVGEGHMHEELERRAQDLGIADRVTLTGPFPRHELRGIYESADLFVFPSVVDTQAFVLNEAAHAGLPLLVSDGRVNPVVRAGESAVVVDHSPQAFAHGFERLCDGRLRDALGAQARQFAAAFTEAGQTAHLESILRRAIGRRALAAPSLLHAPEQLTVVRPVRTTDHSREQAGSWTE